MENTEATTALLLDCKRVGKNGTAVITAKFGEDTLAVEKVDLAKTAKRAEFVALLCKGRPGIDSKLVETELLRMAGAVTEQKDDDATEQAHPELSDAADLLNKMPEAVRDGARAMLESPDLFKKVLDDIAGLGVAGERPLVGAIYLTGTSRLLSKPLALIAQGPSSSGKTYVIEATAKTFPPEAVIHATQMTPQALFHMRPGSLVHRFVVAGERSRQENDDTAEATRALREMISSGRLVKLMPIKIKGEIVTEPIEQDGPISYVESTTLSKIFDEDANRCILVTTDERPDQTKRIVTTLAARYGGAATGAVTDQIVQRHHAVQRMLQRFDVVIPFAERLGELFISDRVETRRAFPQLMSTIQASALLHQLQRQVDADGRLIATGDDYQLARHLLGKPFARLLGGALSDPALRFFERLEAWAVGRFTTTEAIRQERGRSSERSVRGWLTELEDGGAVELVEAGKGPKPTTWQLSGESRESFASECAQLPSLEKVFTPNP